VTMSSPAEIAAELGLVLPTNPDRYGRHAAAHLASQQAPEKMSVGELLLLNGYGSLRRTEAHVPGKHSVRDDDTVLIMLSVPPLAA